MPDLPARLAVLVVCAAAWVANDGKLITVEQRDPLRSARAARTVDISANGRYVAFESWARLVAADADNLPDIYVLDRDAGRVTLESDGPIETENSYPRISADGRRLVFEARAVQPDTQPRVDVALRDRAASTVRLLTEKPGGSPFEWSRQPDISDDGEVVVFASASTVLVSGADANAAREDVYALRLATGAIERVSVTSDGTQLATGSSTLPAVSGDGRYIAFTSTAPLDGAQSTATGQDSLVRQVFLRDSVSRTTTRISRPMRGARTNGESASPSISADGRYVTFTSDASNIVDDDSNRGADVFLVDRETMTSMRVSRGDGGSKPSGVSLAGVISSDGRYIVYQSDAGNLACASRCTPAQRDINLLWDIFLFDRITGKTSRMSEDELGGWMEWSAGPAIDGAGQVVAFSSRHPTDAQDLRHDLDLFIRRR
jgi:Tol biopolymer transport system component